MKDLAHASRHPHSRSRGASGGIILSQLKAEGYKQIVYAGGVGVGGNSEHRVEGVVPFGSFLLDFFSYSVPDTVAFF